MNGTTLGNPAYLYYMSASRTSYAGNYTSLYSPTATNSTTCPTVRKQIGKTTYIVRVHFSQTAKETMEDKIKRLLREEVRKM